MDTDLLRFFGPTVTDGDVASACAVHRPARVELHRCDRITDVSPLAAVAGLQSVHIQGCRSLRYLGSLGQRKTALRQIVFEETPILGTQLRDIMSAGHVEVVMKNNVGNNEYDRPAQSLVKRSIDMIRDIANTFSPHEVGVAFNGGKDSVVVLDLLQCALGRETVKKFCLFTLGASDCEEFSELVGFRDSYALENDLTILNVDPLLSMRGGLAYVKNTRGIRLVFMGTRSTDSDHQKKEVEFTTEGWPEMLRASPVFHWGYRDIWGYTLAYNLPFCSLYLKGFTSVGLYGRTSQNILLRCIDGTFRPAWELDDASAEREGRCG